ncbi:porin family protein [Paraflavisolibacter sp. H34]|uniref:porin family protein n=1 Tax=Huijunlia imazamoxiresistens TaxID=3127457 RepID=UPI003018B3AC
MKKISFIALLFAGLSAQAQLDGKLGVKGGLNLSSIKGLGASSSSKAGLHLGLLSHLHIAPEWSLQPEVMYSNQGATYKSGGEEHNLALHYINIPIQLQYMFNNGFRLQTGPQLGLLVDVTDKVDGEDQTTHLTSDYFKVPDVSWTFGTSYLTYSGFGLDARYNLGLSKINDKGTGTLKNSVWQFGVFYLFDHKHKAHSR